MVCPCYRCYNVSVPSAFSPSSLLFPLSDLSFLFLSPPPSVVFFLSFLSSSFGVLPALLPFHSCSSPFSSSYCSLCPFVLFVCFPILLSSPSPSSSAFSYSSALFSSVSSLFVSLFSLILFRLLLPPSHSSPPVRLCFSFLL